MKKIKIAIIIIAVMIFIIIIGLFVLNRDKGNVDTSGDDVQLSQVSEVIDFSMYYSIENCLNKYLDDIIRVKNTETVYQMLEKNYINEFKITQDNVIGKLNTFDGINTFELNINNIYSYTQDYNIITFFVYGTVDDNSTKAQEQFNVIFKLDNEAQTFAILPEEYMIKYGYNNYNQINNYVENIQNIQANENNLFEYISIDDSERVNYYFETYREALNNNEIEKSYQMLDEEYRNAKFGNIGNYQRYVNENRDKILSMSIQLYGYTSENSGMLFVCTNQYSENIIIKCKNAINFSIMLDSGTININENELEIIDSENTIEEEVIE